MSNDVSSGDTNVITIDSDVTVNVSNEVNTYAVCFVSVLIHTSSRVPCRKIIMLQLLMTQIKIQISQHL